MAGKRTITINDVIFITRWKLSIPKVRMHDRVIWMVSVHVVSRSQTAFFFYIRMGKDPNIKEKKRSGYTRLVCMRIYTKSKVDSFIMHGL